MVLSRQRPRLRSSWVHLTTHKVVYAYFNWFRPVQTRWELDCPNDVTLPPRAHQYRSLGSLWYLATEVWIALYCACVHFMGDPILLSTLQSHLYLNGVLCMCLVYIADRWQLVHKSDWGGRSLLHARADMLFLVDQHCMTVQCMQLCIEQGSSTIYAYIFWMSEVLGSPQVGSSWHS